MLTLLAFAVALTAAPPPADQAVAAPIDIDAMLTAASDEAARPEADATDEDDGLTAEDLDSEAAPTPAHAEGSGPMLEPPATAQAALPLDKTNIGHFNPPVLGVGGVPLR